MLWWWLINRWIHTSGYLPPSLIKANYFSRKQAFEEDLAHYLGESWQSNVKSPALENYIEHLQNIEKEQPMLLLVYVYHLYLGLLSGGQILAKKRKMFGESMLFHHSFHFLFRKCIIFDF